MNDECEAEEKVEVRPFFMADMMKLLSELETVVWKDYPFDRVRMQNIIIVLKSNMIQIGRDGKDIITVDGLKYKRCFE